MTEQSTAEGSTPSQNPTPWAVLFGADASALAPDVVRLITEDRALEQRSLNFIASASYCPLGLRQIEGTHLVNRSPMGLPGRRTVANCEFLDTIEQTAIDRAMAVFGAEYVNAQAISSTVANVAVLRAVLPSGSAKLLSFDEVSGGHVSHGASRHITGDNREVRAFGTTSTGAIDYEEARKTALMFRPDIIVAGASSYPREIDFSILRSIADEVGALLFSDIAHVAGLIVAGLHANPVPLSDVATTSTQKTLCGPRNGAFVFAKARFGDAIDAAIFPGLQGPAAPNLIAARAILMELVTRPCFTVLMNKVVENARALCDGLSASDVALYTGGTDSHIVLAHVDDDWTAKKLVEKLGLYGVTGNAMRVPTSHGQIGLGFRFGTTAMTIRGLDPSMFVRVGALLGEIFKDGPGASVDTAKKNFFTGLACSHPIPSYTD